MIAEAKGKQGSCKEIKGERGGREGRGGRVRSGACGSRVGDLLLDSRMLGAGERGGG